MMDAIFCFARRIFNRLSRFGPGAVLSLENPVLLFLMFILMLPVNVLYPMG
jgi:hypothetical protein